MCVCVCASCMIDVIVGCCVDVCDVLADCGDIGPIRITRAIHEARSAASPS